MNNVTIIEDINNLREKYPNAYEYFLSKNPCSISIIRMNVIQLSFGLEGFTLNYDMQDLHTIQEHESRY